MAKTKKTTSRDITEKPPRRPKKTSEPSERYIPPDGKPRSVADQRRINANFALLFSSEVGKQVKLYLESISTRRVLPPGTPSETITYHEGARWLMGVIDTRIRHGVEKSP